MAGLFVRSGDDFVRVTTNAKTGKSSCALGVLLDTKGPAIEKIRRGEAYCGESFVQDTAYIAGCEPIRDATSKDISILRDRIREAAANSRLDRSLNPNSASRPFRHLE